MNSKEIITTEKELVGLHSFIVYEGDIKLPNRTIKQWFEQIILGRPDSRKPTNKVVYESPVYRNLIVTTGKNLMLDRLFNLSSAVAITSVGVGTDSTAAAVGQTQLNPSVAGSVLIQTADSGTARASSTVTIKSTFGTGVANFTWNEAGLFNGNTNGSSTMFNRVVIRSFY